MIGVETGIAGAYALILVALGCGASSPPSVDVTAEQVAVAAFGADDLRCVVNSTTRAQSQICRADVHTYWCTHGLKDACGWDGGAP